MKLLGTLLLSVLGLTIVGPNVYDSLTEKTRFEILANQRLHFTPSFNTERRVASDEKLDYEAIFLKANPRNQSRINGTWAIVFYEKSGLQSEIIIPVNPQQVYVSMVADSTISIEKDGVKKDLQLIDIQDGNIRAFAELDNYSEYYELSLIRLSTLTPKTLRNVTRLSPKKVITASSKVSNTNNNETEVEDIYLELKEAYDVVEKKIVKSGIQGEIDIVNGRVNTINALVNNTEIFPTNIIEGNQGLYTYEANGTSGSFQGTFVNGSDYNIYFTDGAYKGYTLIFSRALTAEERYEKEELERKRMQAEYDNVSSIAESELEAPADQAQEAALQAREQISQLRNPANNFNNEYKEEAALFLNETKDVALRAARGEKLTIEEIALLEEREEVIGDMGGVNLSSF